MQGMLELPHGMEDDLDNSNSGLDAPDWVFRPARGEL